MVGYITVSSPSLLLDAINAHQRRVHKITPDHVRLQTDKTVPVSLCLRGQQLNEYSVVSNDTQKRYLRMSSISKYASEKN